MNVSTLLNYVDWKQLGVAPITRRSPWDPGRIARLMNALYLAHPVGEFVLWRPDATAASLFKEHDLVVAEELIVDGSQRIATIHRVLRGHLNCVASGTPSQARLFFDLKQQTFVFRDSGVSNDDPLCVDLREFFTVGPSRVGIFATKLYPKLSEVDSIGDFAQRLQRLADIQNRDLCIAHMPKHSSLKECQEFYNLANGVG